jgi:hypothetical protein
MLAASRMTSSTAAINSMNTPALFKVAISLTPHAFTTVEKMIRMVPRITAFTASF